MTEFGDNLLLQTIQEFNTNVRELTAKLDHWGEKVDAVSARQDIHDAYFKDMREKKAESLSWKQLRWLAGGAIVGGIAAVVDVIQRAVTGK